MQNREYILCSAIRRLEPRKCTRHYYENDIYEVELGYRHCDIFARFPNELSRKPQDQGFYTSKGRFVDRREAMKIAFEAGQLHPGVHPYNDDGVKLQKYNLEKVMANNYAAVIAPNLDHYKSLYSEDLY